MRTLIRLCQSVLLLVLIVIAILLIGTLGQLLHERRLCEQDIAELGGTCQLERDSPFEYHYYFYPTDYRD